MLCGNRHSARLQPVEDDTRFIKVKTKLFYKQKKFNLYESEGYAKLTTELNQAPGDTSPAYLLQVNMSTDYERQQNFL